MSINSAQVILAFSDGEVPSGVKDGTNNVYRLVANPIAGSLLLFRNGLLQTAGADYDISQNVITFRPAVDGSVVPKPTDQLICWYRYWRSL